MKWMLPLLLILVGCVDDSENQDSGSAPRLNFSVSESQVQSGGTVVLSWDTDNATQCEASGDWSGNKATSGNETTSALIGTSSFTLTCNGQGGMVEQTIIVSVLLNSDATVYGVVDSSLVNRLSTNKVYVYSGHVSPDDQDGDSGDPLIVAEVTQTPGTCNFSYIVNGLVNGNYTLAFTNEAADDIVNQNNNINFIGTYNFTYNDSPVQHDISADTIHRVGPTRPYKTVRAAAAIANAGDVIEIDAGDYPDDIVVWRTDNITIRGIGGRAHIRSTYMIPYSGTDLENGMGLWVVKADGIRIENIEFSNASVPDENGAGVRNQGRDLTICNCYFHDNEDGFLGGAYGTLIVEYSEFNHNGLNSVEGKNHNIYVDDGDTLIFRYNYSHHAVKGHLLKSKPKVSYVLYNRFTDEAGGNSSYQIDLPYGGLGYIVGNVLQKGVNTDNSGTAISYAKEEFLVSGPHKLHVVNNTYVNNSGNSEFVSYGHVSVVQKPFIANNLIVGDPKFAQVSNPDYIGSANLITLNPQFQDANNFDYRLTENSPGIDNGASNLISNEGVDLTPIYHYMHPAGRVERPYDGAIDIGAYEYQ